MYDGDPLRLDPEEMRRLGHRTVDMLVARLADPGAGPAVLRASADELEARVGGGPAPAAGEDFDRLLEQLDRDVLPFASHWEHPRMFAFVPASPTFPGTLGDLIASACNLDAGAWLWGAGPSRVELVVLDWFKEWIGYPDDAAGVLVSGGSAATMTALACAREALIGPMAPDVVAYCSDQAHSSVARAARNLGFRPDQMRVLPTDERFRLRPETLASAIEADLGAGRRPLFAVASAGTTGVGAIDPAGELAAVAHEHGAWLHVDGAYGAFAILTEQGKGWLQGIELADSITLDPHKWLYQPFECGCLLVRDGRRLDEAFVVAPEYLKEVESGRREVNFADRGFQLTRASRALKLWLSLRFFGLDAFRRAIADSLELAAHAQRLIERSERLELLFGPSLGVVCFRRRFDGVDDEEELAELNGDLVEALAESGVGMVSSTRLRGRYAIRMCVMNHTTTAADVEEVVRWLESAPTARSTGARTVAAPERDPHLPAAAVRLERGRIDARGLAELPLFASLRPDQLERLARAARVAVHAPGETIARQWDAARDFYVLAEGTVEVSRDGEYVRAMGPGEFFGELAALEWGAGFGYPRLASVVATSPVRAVVIGTDALNALLREAPGVAAQVRRKAAERLARDV